PNRHAPYVGESAFAHKGGIHVSAVQKDPRTYEHVPPESVGNRRKLLVSDQAGRSNILAELDRIGIPIPKDDPRIGKLLDEVKEREATCRNSSRSIPSASWSSGGTMRLASSSLCRRRR